MQHSHRDAIPPAPIVHDMTLADWLLGCALMNPNVEPHNAVAYVRGSLNALKAPRVSNRIDPPTEDEMARWVSIINNMSRETSAPVRVVSEAHASTIPIVNEESGIRAVTRPIKKHG